MIFSFKMGGLLNTTDPKAIGFHGYNVGYWSFIIRGNGDVDKIGTFNFFKLHGIMMWFIWGFLGFL
jgi:hypothetical protein